MEKIVCLCKREFLALLYDKRARYDLCIERKTAIEAAGEEVVFLAGEGE